MALSDLAGRLEAASDAVAGTGTTLNRLDPSARAFGGDAPGRFGELGRQFHVLWTAAVAARGREAGEQAARLAQTAEAIREAEATYHGVERAARDNPRVQEP